MTSVLGLSWGRTKSHAQEFKLLETHDEMKDGSEKKTEYPSSGKRRQGKKVATHTAHG